MKLICRFEGIRLMNGESSFATFITGCEIAFVCFLVYFTLHEIFLMIKLKIDYFKLYWSYCELAMIFAGYMLILFYLLRLVINLTP